MNRRRFLVAAPLVVVGCSRSSTPTLTETPQVIVDQASARAAHLTAIASHRVPANYGRTTPKPSRDLTLEFPQLKGLAKLTMRLHPRYSDTRIEPPRWPLPLARR
jgi:hypothetical protein